MFTKIFLLFLILAPVLFPFTASADMLPSPTDVIDHPTRPRPTNNPRTLEGEQTASNTPMRTRNNPNFFEKILLIGEKTSSNNNADRDSRTAYLIAGGVILASIVGALIILFKSKRE